MAVARQATVAPCVAVAPQDDGESSDAEEETSEEEDKALNDEEATPRDEKRAFWNGLFWNGAQAPYHEEEMSRNSSNTVMDLERTPEAVVRTEKVEPPHVSQENRLKRPYDLEHLDLENRPKHTRVLGELEDVAIETSRSMEDRSLSETPKTRSQSVMGITALIADSDEPQAIEVVNVATDKEPAPKDLCSQPELGLEISQKSEDSVDISRCEWEDNPWGITMEVAKRFVDFKKEERRLETMCKETLKDLLEWRLDVVARQTFTILNRLETILNTRPSAKKTDIPHQIQQQVHEITSASRSSQLLRPAFFFWLSQLASTINEHDKGGYSTAVGRSTLSDVYDLYVQAEYPDRDSYEAAKKHDSTAIRRKRDSWKRKRETGGKILRLAKEYGLGVVFCIPNRCTYSYFERMPVGYLELLVHGLKNGPDASMLKSICQQMSEKVADFVQSRMTAEEYKKSIAKDFYSALSEQNIVPGSKNNHDCDELITQAISKFPDWMGNTNIGSLNACPVLTDIKTLSPGQDINDEVIRTVLGQKLKDIKPERNIRVLDPSHFSQAKREAIGLKKVETDLECMLIPIHHDKDQHWTLVSVDFGKKTITHMDSSKSLERNFKTKPKVIKFLSASGISSDFEWLVAKVVQQQGRHCAIHVMVNAIALLEGSSLPDEVSGPAKRLEYTQYILAAFWKNFCTANND